MRDDNGAEEQVALARAADDLFADFCSPEVVGTVEQVGWHDELWSALTQVGFDAVSVPEHVGGVGGSDEDALVILRSAGQHAASVPLAEAGLLAGWLLSSAKLDLPTGVRTVVEPGAGTSLVEHDGRVSGSAQHVAWGHRADWIVALIGDGPQARVVTLPGPASVPSGVTVTRRTNLAGEPRDTVTFDNVEVLAGAAAAPGVDQQAFLLRGAAARGAQMAGALTALAGLVTGYTGQRHQFGRPLRAFQAVQSHVVTVHQQAALTGAALDGVLSAGRTSAPFEIAALKVLANRAATIAARAAHQAHGAMGMTQEYPLHLFTRRLWAWRNQYGDAEFWSGRIGAAAVAAGPDALYSIVQHGSTRLVP